MLKTLPRVFSTGRWGILKTMLIKVCPSRHGSIALPITWWPISHRDHGRRKIIPLDDYVAHTLHSDAPEKQAEASDEQETLMKAIGRLPAERQQLILLKFIHQKSNAEIGDIMNRTEGAIKSLYHRTLIALRDEIQMQDMKTTMAKPDADSSARKQGKG